MSNVIPFRGGKKHGIDPNPDNVLNGAVGEVSMVLVLGVAIDGKDYFSTSTTDPAEVLMLIENFKFKLLNGDFYED